MSKEAMDRASYRPHERKNGQYFVRYVPNPNTERIFPNPNTERGFVAGEETIRRRKRKRKK